MLILTISKYRKIINGKLYLYYTLANLNILLYLLVYATAYKGIKRLLGRFKGIL